MSDITEFDEQVRLMQLLAQGLISRRTVRERLAEMGVIKSADEEEARIKAETDAFNATFSPSPAGGNSIG